MNQSTYDDKFDGMLQRQIDDLKQQLAESQARETLLIKYINWGLVEDKATPDEYEQIKAAVTISYPNMLGERHDPLPIPAWSEGGE